MRHQRLEKKRNCVCRIWKVSETRASTKPKWWFAILVVDFFILMWVGAMPAEGIYPIIALIASTYWFGYFLVILPLLGVIEKPMTPPATIEDDFNAHYGSKAASGDTVASPAE